MEHMNIALCTDSTYVMPTVVCMKSAIINSAVPITFYILYNRLTQADREHIQKHAIANSSATVEFIRVNEDVFKTSPTLGRSREAYFRLLIPSLLPPGVDRCLYLDGDVLVVRDPKTFYATPFEEKMLVACRDLGEIVFFHKERHEVLGIPIDYQYFNSGILLFNMDLFRKHASIDSIVDYIDQNHEKLTFIDQDVLNALFYDKTRVIEDIRCNYMEILINPLLTNPTLDQAVMIHFVQKPWRYSYSGANANLWWNYAKKIYPLKYIVFQVKNFVYRKSLNIVLLFISAKTLKRAKRLLSSHAQ